MTPVVLECLITSIVPDESVVARAKGGHYLRLSGPDKRGLSVVRRYIPILGGDSSGVGARTRGVAKNLADIIGTFPIMAFLGILSPHGLTPAACSGTMGHAAGDYWRYY